jgi:hypothetical protein
MRIKLERLFEAIVSIVLVGYSGWATVSAWEQGHPVWAAIFAAGTLVGAVSRLLQGAR